MEADEIRKKIIEEKKDSSSTNSSPNLKNPQLLFSWTAPLRAYKKKSKGVLRFYIALALLLSLIAFFLGERILILPIAATMFLVYVLTITPPPQVHNKITKFGIETAGNTYRWEALSHFYFIKKFDYHQLVLVSVPPYNLHIYLVIKDPMHKEKVLKHLSEHLIYQEEPNMNMSDKVTNWMSKLMPDAETAPSEQVG